MLDDFVGNGPVSRRRLVAPAAAAALFVASSASAAPLQGRPVSESGIRRALRERAAAMMLFDTHEHLHRESERLSQPADIFLLFSTYLRSDLVSAGMDRNSMLALDDTTVPLEVRWKSVAPYWPFASTTGYGRATLIAARDLYGVEEINDKTYLTLSARVSEANRPGVFKRILRDKARIGMAVLDDKMTMRGEPLRPDPEYFRLSVRFEYITLASTRQDLQYVEKMTGVSVSSLPGLERALEKRMDRALQEGMSAIKMGFAYDRTLEVGRTTRAEAERAFETLFASGGTQPPDAAAAKRLQDYLIHREVEHAAERHLPIQIHTGLLTGNKNENLRTNPSLLSPMISQHPRVRFGLMHGGYPYMSELAAMAKNLQNVYADLCWLHMIAPVAAVRLLDELIDAVPGNKILGFGGDSRQLEHAYAHAQMARAVTVEVLAAKAERGDLTETAVMALLDRILHSNGKDLFSSHPEKSL